MKWYCECPEQTLSEHAGWEWGFNTAPRWHVCYSQDFSLRFTVRLCGESIVRLYSVACIFSLSFYHSTKIFCWQSEFCCKTSRTDSSMLHMLLYRTALFGKYFTVTTCTFLNYQHFPFRSIEIHLRSGCSQWRHLNSFTVSGWLMCAALRV